ncbi:hypothetical protein LEN26_007505 [Aphanomyces euteiches]|nr:hypothetical protein AeMF1_017101 [Aphanomyces euteiches]KAH9132140.1 hypothetical protein LEN26_007505 [Aphanomyces euteiches]KAH9189077.1 hypothetical protein AeNC1_008945 [Aphanomyces euteiches]
MMSDDGDDGFELDFLPPVDEDLLCQVETSDSISETTNPSLSKAKSRRKRTNGLQTEVQTLRAEKVQLENKLAELEANHTTKRSALSKEEQKWEEMARKQLELRLKATSMQKELESIMFKKPRVMMMQLEDEQWRVLKLSADSEKRILGLQSIANRQLDSIDSDMLTLGLVDSTKEINYVRHDTVKQYSEGIRCTKLEASSFAQVEEAIWKTLIRIMTQFNIMSPNATPYSIQKYAIDDCTVFLRLAYSIPRTESKMESSFVVKKQELEPSVRRIIFRSILDDEAIPFDAKSYVSDNYGWIHIEENEDTSFVYKCFMRSNFSMLQPDDVDNLADLMDAIYLNYPVGKVLPSDAISIAKTLFQATFEQFQTILLGRLSSLA